MFKENAIKGVKMKRTGKRIGKGKITRLIQEMIRGK